MCRRAIPRPLVAALLAILPLLAAGCGSSSTGSRFLGPGRIRAQVTANGQPAAGVTVSLSNGTTRTATTDANGVADFESLTSGTYSVAVTSFNTEQLNFSTQPVSVMINTQTGPVEAVVTFQGTGAPTGSFAGLLTVNGQAPFLIPDQQITATLTPPGGAQPVSVNLTGSLGQLFFQQLVPGTYTLQVSVGGQVRTTTFTLAQGQQLQQNVEFTALTPAG